MRANARRTAIALGVAAALAGAAASAAEPQAALEEVVVTAQKRTESLQDVPVAVSVVTGEDVLRQGVTQIDDALRNLANVAVTQGPTGLNVTIRGVGPSLPQTLGGAAGVSTTFDGVYDNNDISSRLGFYDLARIEVLRGPQGTLYGRNAEGGAVNTVTANPTQERAAAFSAELGNYALKHVTGMANVPLTDSLALRVAGGFVERDGFLSNGQDDNQALGMRVKLLYAPGENVSLLLASEFSRVGGKGPGTTGSFVDAPSARVAYTNIYPTNQRYDRHGWKAWAQLDADVGIGTLTVLPAYQDLSQPDQLQYTGLTQSRSNDADGQAIQRSAEVRLASDDASRLKWVVGYYAYTLGQVADSQRAILSLNGVNVTTLTPGVSYANALIIDSPVANTRTTTASTERSTAAFGQLTVPVGERFRVLAGLRHSKDEKTRTAFRPTTSALSADWSHTDWKAGVEFDVGADSLLYATAATGYRPGGFSPAPPFPAFDLETLRSYEIGSKNTLLGRTLRLNASVFYYDYKGYQLPNLIPCGFTGAPACLNPASPFNLAILNLPKVVNVGAEIDAQWAPTDADTLVVSAAYLDSEIRSAVVVRPPFPAGANLDGNALPNSPKLTFAATYRHAFALGGAGSLTPAVTVRRTGASYISIPQALPVVNQSGYWQEDASIEYVPASGAWTLNAYVKNATQEVVKSNFVGSQMTLQSPRTYGVVFTSKF